ncbi:hypothetical protein [Hubei sobemo-like virus 43]|uniref:hypothetical protein n=1 Tax=Hubei sobemo-like virus 43 TaxID=1923231 RepID=UPI00090C4A25|nr:hypothetical protein [Hubei sobemo-like virus 43]APG75635.1 hypothetical protein [Hubei sobemo-like virus 43]
MTTASFMFALARKQLPTAPPNPGWGIGLARPTLREGLVLVGGVAATAASGYAVYSVGCWTMSACRRLRSWWAKPLKLRPAPSGPVVGECVPESAVPGSEERPMTPPKGQALVGFSDGSSFMVVGCAVRMEDWLVMPDHVKSALGDRRLEIRSMDHKRVVTLHNAEVEAMQLVDTDLLAVQLSPARFSEIGLAKVTVGPNLAEKFGAFSAIVGAFGKGTTGTVKHAQLFGKITYTGSTFKGYSGAAYMAGTQLVGIHLHGGTVNAGYSASYVLAMLKHMFRIKDEGSDEWLEGMRRQGAEVVVDQDWRDMDECRIRVAGRYHIIGVDTMSRVYGADWRRSGKRNLKTDRFVDLESCVLPGESSETLSGGSRVSVPSNPSLAELANQLTLHELEKLRERLALRAKDLRASATGSRA